MSPLSILCPGAAHPRFHRARAHGRKLLAEVSILRLAKLTPQARELARLDTRHCMPILHQIAPYSIACKRRAAGVQAAAQEALVQAAAGGGAKNIELHVPIGYHAAAPAAPGEGRPAPGRR